MRILMISRCPPYPLHLGDRLIIYHLARELSKRGHVIDLLAFAERAEDFDADEQARYRAYYGDVFLQAAPCRSLTSYIKRLLLPGKRFPRRAADSWSPPMWRMVAEQLAQERYEAVHLFGGVQVYEFLGALGDIPAIIVPYESFSLYMRRIVEASGASRLGMPRHAPTRMAAWLQWRLARRYESWMYAPFRRTVVVSGRDKDELLGIDPDLSVTVIPNGIDLDYFQPQASQRETARLLFTGNYEYAPNVDAALRLATEILPRIRERVPEATLWLVGNAPTPEMLALANEHITVTGRVADMRAFLAQATVFVSPLRLGAGIKNKVLEALAMGCAVAATPLSMDGIAIRNEQEALIAEGDALGEAIIRLLGDADLRATLGAQGRKLIEEQYSWGQVATRYEQLYDAIQERA